MCIALFSDIHVNSVALDAVLADIEVKGGVDAYWLLGDFVVIGSDPIGVMKRLLGLSNAVLLEATPTDMSSQVSDLPLLRAKSETSYLDC